PARPGIVCEISVDRALGEEIDGYRIVSVLGQGGMGIVYKAEDLALGRAVALKMIAPDFAHDEAFLGRFRREAHALARINSPHIVTIYTLRNTDRGLFIVMEYVDGGTLAELLKQSDLPLERAVALFKGVLRALGDAHRVSVIHRDIKPSNVMLTRAGQVKLTDFGLAKVHHPDAATTVTQGTAGTLYYMSPEQVRAVGRVEHRTDIYSAGMMFYEMLAGRRPFDPSSGQYTIMRQIVEGTLPPVRTFNDHVPDALVEIVEKALEKDPAARYQNTEAMLRALERFEQTQEQKQETEPPSTLSETLPLTRTASRARPEVASPVQRLPKPAKKRKRSELLAVGATLLLGLGLVAFMAADSGQFNELLGRIWASGAPVETTTLPDVPPDPPLQARLAIRVDQPGATVWIDGKEKGLAPLAAFEVPSGSLDVRVQKTGHALFDTTLVLAPEEAENLAVALHPNPVPLGRLRVRSDPDSATVLLGGKRVGETPYDAPVTVGRYPIVVQKEGYEPYRAEADVRAGATAALEATLERKERLLRVLVMPYGAVYVDGTQKPKPQSGWYEESLPLGTYDVRAEHPTLGYWKKRVTISSDSSHTVRFDFRRTFKLRVVASTLDGQAVRNAQIYIDGALHNRPTPREITLQAGTHTIEVRKAGYELIGGAREITLEEDAEQPLEFTLEQAG
ncbi:MAG: serine/threonine-protein kinase, partial [Rhodothermales bacterium]